METERITSLEGLFLEQLRDLYDAENRIIAALPKMIDKATNSDLKQGLSEHLEETKGQLNRLTEIGKTLSTQLIGESCEATRGLVLEGEKTMAEIDDSHVRDAAIVASAQRIEHYEIASYGCAIEFAECLDVDRKIIDLLKDTLSEEKEADKKLTKVATGGLIGKGINEAAKA